MTKELSIWEDKSKLKEIRLTFANNATETEFRMMVELGRVTGLSPYLREIWLVKYGNAPATIFIGRDGYRKSAQRQPAYDFHQPDAVYKNDSFKICKGEIEHSYNFQDRGELVGAYCTVKRHDSSRPIYVYVDFKEYSSGKSLWATKPATMIKKVAEAQALRLAFQDVFAGTYSEAEEFKQMQTEKLKEQLAKQDEDSGRVIEAQAQPMAQAVQEATEDEKITEEEILTITGLIKSKEIQIERVERFLNYCKVEKISELNRKQAAHFIMLLNKEPEVEHDN